MAHVRDMRAWLNLEDYAAAIHDGINDTVSRFARGNISFQNGSVLEEDDLRALSKKGDKAIKKLTRRAASA
ncbi:MAG: hypothetical protein IPK78_06415 [Rhodospirillales bacterium]|nr:hypothetical protein [Rhodospirillales bacterium]